jgi:hypothetical protein
MFRKFLKLGILGLAVALTSSLLSVQLFGQSRGQFAANVPLTYTAIMRDNRSLAPDRSDGDEYFIRGARRSEGSTARISLQVSEDGPPVESRTVFDLTKAQYVILDSALSSTTTTSLTDQAVKSKRDRRQGCEGEPVSKVLGYDVILRSFTPPIQIPVAAKYGQMREDSLVAPALGCLVMESNLIMAYHDGSERVIRSERVVDVQVGEPDADYFSIPEGYRELSPAARMSAHGQIVNLASDEMLQNFEQVYDARRVR